MRVEARPMDGGTELAGDRNDRTLGLASYLIPQQQEDATCAVGGVDQLSGEFLPVRRVDGDLSAARIVQASRQIDERQIGGTTVLRTSIAEVGRLVAPDTSVRGGEATLQRDGANHGSGCPRSFGTGDGYVSVAE